MFCDSLALSILRMKDKERTFMQMMQLDLILIMLPIYQVLFHPIIFLPYTYERKHSVVTFLRLGT